MIPKGRWDWGDRGVDPQCLRWMPKTFAQIESFARGRMIDIAPGVFAEPRGGESFAILYHRHHIATVHHGAVELGEPPQNLAAMHRVNAILQAHNFDCRIAHGFMHFPGPRSDSEKAIERLSNLAAWSLGATGHEKRDVCSLARDFGFYMPARKGFRSDFDARPAEQVLHVGCRLGNREAADMLVLCLRERGETVMANAVLENKGRAFWRRWMQKDMQTLFDAVWVTSDEGEWLFDLETKKLVRPLTTMEVALMKLRAENLDELPATTTMPDGVTYGVTIGSDHVAHDKGAPRRIEQRRRRP